MGKIAAVTGAGGFVGRRLVTGLAQRGWYVYAITSHPENIPAASQVTVVRSTWTEEGIERAIAQAQDAVLWVHAAARIEFGDENVLHLYRDNALLTEHLVRRIARLDTSPRVIYLSTISVYGPGQEVNVSVEPRPDTHYGLSKLLGERFCLAYLGKRCLIYRLAGVWGKEKSPKLFINRCLQQAEAGYPLRVAGLGKSKRNYLWVGDVAAIVDLAFSKGWYGILLAGGPEPISIRDMVTAIGRRFGVPVYFEKKDGNEDEHDVLVKNSSELETTSFYQALNIETSRNS